MRFHILCLWIGWAGIVPSHVPKRVLVYTVSADFEHEVVHRETPEELSLVERTLVEMGRKTGDFEAVVSRDAHDFALGKLSTIDLVFFYTTGELPLSKDEREALLAFVKQGGAFAGAHCATDTFYRVPEYGEMIGAYFDGHPWHQEVRVKVEDRGHPATRHLGESFRVADEIYQFRLPYDRSKLHVLLSLDTSSVDTKSEAVHRTDGDFALAWTKDFGKGRVFYTALGHEPGVWKDERYLAHLDGGFRWAMRIPNEGLPKDKDAPKDPGAREEKKQGEKQEGGKESAHRAENREGVRIAARSDAEAYRRFALEHRGDPARGFRIFRASRDEAMCIRCHAVFGVGEKFGPDLSEIGAKYGREEILASILTPSQRIAEGYRSSSVELRDGRVLFGMIQRESAQEIDLYDTNGELQKIEKADVASRRTLDTSVMSDGLWSTMTKEDFVDLVEWLTTLRGAPGGK